MTMIVEDQLWLVSGSLLAEISHVSTSLLALDLRTIARNAHIGHQHRNRCSNIPYDKPFAAHSLRPSEKHVCTVNVLAAE